MTEEKIAPESGRRELNIAGKDWLNVAEAAFYCGVSESQFRKRAPDFGLLARRFMGKQLYEKAALYRAIAESPTWYGESPMRDPRHTSPVPGLATLAIGPELADRLRNHRLRPYKPRKKPPF